jgi:hypothetical protein
MAVVAAAALSNGQVQAQRVPNGPQPIVCVGVEDLPGYGKLVFSFLPKGQVIMSDVEGTALGSWSLQGNVIRLTFHNGTVVYEGMIQGEEIAGRATNGRAMWSWRVRLVPVPVDPGLPRE